MSEIDSFTKAVVGYELFGQKLRKWSTDRKNAADCMGLMWPMLGESRWAAWEETGRYPGMKKDVAIILWLLSLKAPSELTLEEIKGREWTPDRAFNSPSQAVEAAMTWIEGQDYADPTTPKFYEAANVALALVSGVAAAQFEVASSEPSDGEKKMENSSPQPGLV